MDNALKAISRTDEELRIGNYIVLFGGRDLEGIHPGTTRIDRPNPDGSQGDFFTSTTALESPYTKSGVLMVDWQHGEGKELFGVGPGADDVLGYVDWKTAKVDERGVFVERVLDLRNKYVQWVEGLIDQGLIGTSSRAILAGIEKAADGEILRWPLEMDTLTVVPMEPRNMQEFGENTLQAFKALGITVPGHTEAEPEATPEADPSAVVAARAQIDLFLTELAITELEE